MVRNLLILVTAITLISSCEKGSTPCDDPEEVYYKFSDDTLLIPYSVGDSLHFQIQGKNDSILDTVLFVASQRVRTIVDVYGKKCVIGTPKGDAMTIIFTSSAWELPIKYYYESQQTSPVIEVSYKNSLYRTTPLALNGKLGFDYNTLELAGSLYNDVDATCELNEVPPDLCPSYLLLINSEDGILTFRTYAGERFTLIKKF